MRSGIDSISIDTPLLPATNLAPDEWDGKTLAQVRREILDRAERLYLQMVLRKSRGRIGKAAAMAGIHSSNLYNLMKKLGLKKEDFK